MGFFGAIGTIAKYERKTMLRSWFFIILSVLTLLVVSARSLGLLYAGEDYAWVWFAFSSDQPFIILSMFNMFLSFILVFISSNFILKDKKLDTVEVVFVRPISNIEYILGKTWGALQVFMGFAILVALEGAVFHLIGAGFSGVKLSDYLFFLFLLIFPSVIYILGLSYLMTALLRNRAVSLVLLLLYIVVVVFIIPKEASGLFDFCAGSFTLTFSDIAPMAFKDTFLQHRLTYLLLGIAFLLLSTLLLRRIANGAKLMLTVLASLILLSGLLSLHLLLIEHVQRNDCRTEWADLSDQYFSQPTVSILSQDIKLKHQGEEIAVRTNLLLQNPHDTSLTQVVLSLNPALQIRTIEDVLGQAYSFQRKGQIILIDLNLSAGAEQSIEIHYVGGIDQRVCYLDIDAGYKPYGEYAYLSENYVLLTHESLWYPIAGVRYNARKPVQGRYTFSQFSLEVQTKPGLFAVSQGLRDSLGFGHFLFRPEQALTQLSLAIGNYQEKRVEIDSITYSLYHYPSHDQYIASLDSIRDTLPDLIRQAKRDYEFNLKASYPFERFAIVEVPRKLSVYNRLWTLHQEVVQPEQVLMPEKGSALQRGNVDAYIKQRSRWRRNEARSEKDEKISFVQNVLSTAFTTQGEGASNVMSFIQIGDDSHDKEVAYRWNVFPMYYTYANSFETSAIGGLNTVMEQLLNTAQEDRRARFSRMMSGDESKEEANQDLQVATYARWMDSLGVEPQRISNIIKAKADQLRYILMSEAGSRNLNELLMPIYAKYRFQSIDFDTWIAELSHTFETEDLKASLDMWYEQEQLPRFLLSEMKVHKVSDEGLVKFHIRVSVSNTSDIPGVFYIRINSRGARRGGGNATPAEPIEKAYILAARSTMDIGLLSDQKPSTLELNTSICGNLPSLAVRRVQKVSDSERPLVEYVHTQAYTEQVRHGIIVDNEDEACQVSGTSAQIFAQWFQTAHKDKKYQAYVMWRLPQAWTPMIQASFYGDYIRSAYVIRGGKGEQHVTWTAQIDKKAYYELFFYYDPPISSSRRDNSQKTARVYCLTVTDDEGAHEYEIDMQQYEPGWVLIDKFFCSPGEAKVSLSNKADHVLIGDAVKWVESVN